MTTMNLTNYEVVPNAEAADRNSRALLREAPWIEARILQQRVVSIVESTATRQAKRHALVTLANRANEVVVKHSACRSKCSMCCHIHTSIYEHEAKALAKHTGREMRTLEFRDPGEVAKGIDTFFGLPCPFLVDGACSVYEVRPLACRLHHNLDDVPDQCNTAIRPEDSSVPSQNLKVIEFGYTLLSLQTVEPWGDIREFFP